MAKLVSKTYGDALFELAIEEEKIDELFEEVILLKSVLEDNPDFSRLMNHPKVDKDEKKAVMESVFKGRISDDMTGFLEIIIANNRYSDIFSIMDYFVKQVKEYKRIGTATVTTPLPLDDNQKASVEKKLLDTTVYSSMEMNYVIDESLIGGMIIRIGDKVVDSSIKTRLNNLKTELQKIQLARY